MIEDLAESFRRGGGQETRLPPLYRRISAGTAEDAEVRDLLLETPREQRQPMLLFAAVHYLLLSGAEHRLARWYPTVGGRADRVSDGDPYADFRDFVLGRRAQVTELLATRSTQTNEIGRCAVLRPAWAILTQEVRAPLGLIDLGSSAGLNLLLDQWAYSYSPDGPRYGDPSRDVLVEAESRGAPLPALGPADVRSRVGIDLHPIAVGDDVAVRWLLACVWAEQVTRFQRLQAAIEVARTRPPRVVAADIVEVLPSLAADIPEDRHLAIQNSWVLNYFPAPARQRLKSVMAELGATRDLSWVSIESPEFAPGLDYPPRPDGVDGGGASVAVLSTWRDGQKAVRRLADCHPHGSWVHWW
ncbi:MAG: DUF2332 domain-containing protein [Geodermatophilaceae bacterium]|nr:DUF2332 domain-containing protein [Geodermatophilaceae bacterium]